MTKYLIFCFFILNSYVAEAEVAAPTSGTATSSSSAAGHGGSEIPPSVDAQFPTVRPKPPADPNKESSSFVGDPENLDPLRVKSESLKNDDEPVLEDIRQVLDAPSQIKKKAIQNNKNSKNTSKEITKKKKQKISKKNKTKKSDFSNRSVDDPDARIEKQFYQNYIKYNSAPTSIEAWSAVTKGRNSEVYIVAKGDTLWTISETLFGDSLFWPKIWAINRQGILNPHFILPGMKIYFYPGSVDNIPTLSLDDQDQQNSDMNLTGGSEKDKDDPVVAIPDSLPTYRSDLYYKQKQKVQIIDLAPPKFEPVEAVADFIITDRLVLSDIKIHLDSEETLNCQVGDLIQNYEFIRKATTDEYTMLEAYPTVTTNEKALVYPYRKVGTVKFYDQDKLKIKQCSSIINRSILFVPSKVIDSLKSKKISQSLPQIIGGPDVFDQNYYTTMQVVYLDMGTKSYEKGQVFQVKSKLIDEVVGSVKILDKYGSYALGLINQSEKQITKGDSILVQ